MDQPREEIAIEFISALGLPPVQYVELAADLVEAARELTKRAEALKAGRD
ncbi:MAG: hypothetical protein JWQ90_4675 [Hydrocarboniphaga sp.]|nr:hypothetical protein [Hydrocarboniphaga sp.]MDB5972225.1 hypothetical protein [Hydrocarboniphaga sp.]